MVNKILGSFICFTAVLAYGTQVPAASVQTNTDQAPPPYAPASPTDASGSLTAQKGVTGSRQQLQQQTEGIDQSTEVADTSKKPNWRDELLAKLKLKKQQGTLGKQTSQPTKRWGFFEKRDSDGKPINAISQDKWGKQHGVWGKTQTNEKQAIAEPNGLESTPAAAPTMDVQAALPITPSEPSITTRRQAESPVRLAINSDMAQSQQPSFGLKSSVISPPPCPNEFKINWSDKKQVMNELTRIMICARHAILETPTR